MQLGVMIEGQEGLTWDLWRHLAELTERLGYESLWRSDHLRSLAGVGDRDTIETWASLTYLATATRRIRFGPLVSPMTFRHPSLLAFQAAAVNALSGGRLVLGMGAGWNAPEHEAFGLPFPPVKTRMDMLEDALGMMRALTTEQHASFSGKIYSLQNAYLAPKPPEHPFPPILIGGKGEKRTLRLAARYADEWNASALTPEGFREKNLIFEQHCREVGRDPGEVQRSLMLTFLVAESEAGLREHLARIRQRHPGAAPPEAMDHPEQLRERGWLVGRPEEVVSQLRALEAEGVQRVMLQHLALVYDEPLELIAHAVLPAVA